MTGQVTFNLMPKGLVDSGFTGHMNVTLSRDGQAITLGQNFSIMEGLKQGMERTGDILLGRPFNPTKHNEGILSSEYEFIFLTTSENVIRKSITVDDATYDKVLKFFHKVEGASSDYGFLVGRHCLDFADAVFSLTGKTGQLADLFTTSELEGSALGWSLMQRKQDTPGTGWLKVRTATPDQFIATLSPVGGYTRKPVSSSMAGADLIIPALLLIVVMIRLARKKINA
mgnify:CR=1 FL=1